MHRPFLAILMSLVPLLGQEPPPPKADLRAGTAEVALDVIVRDKRGRPVKDLTASDLAIQDGAKIYKPASMRLVVPGQSMSNEGETAKAAAGEGKPKTLSDIFRQIRLVTFLFEPIPRESARLAGELSRDLVSKAAGPNVYFNVLLARERLKILQPYTNDAKALDAAFRAALSTSGYKQADDMAALAESGLRKLALDEMDFQRLNRGDLPQANLGPGNADASDAVRAQQARVLLNMRAIAESVQREYAGRVSLSALRAAVKALSVLPGRKTIVYVCRGLTSHPSLSQTFRDLTEAANAAGVSVYGVDATGLEISERTREAANMLARAANATMMARENDGSRAVSREEATAFETAEQSAMANPSTLLAELAAGTGGLILTDSNDSRKMAQIIAEDISSYWEVTYRPDIEIWDGSFHPIAVKVDRKGVKVQARKGYFALPPGSQGRVTPYEVPLLNALAASPPPADLLFDAVTTPLEREKATGKTTTGLALEIPLKDFLAEEDATEAVFRFRAAVLALVRDDKGEVVERHSQPVAYQGPAAKLATAREGVFRWRHLFALAPGKYTTEIALQDRIGGKLGVLKAGFGVPEIAQDSLALSGVSWVLPEPAPPSQEAAAPYDPLRTKDTALTPRAGRSANLAGASNGGITLHAIVHNGEGASLEVEILRNGDLEARVPLDAASALPSENGKSIPYVVTIPVKTLEPGEYEFAFTAKLGDRRVRAALPIALRPSPDYVPKGATPVSEEAAATLRVAALRMNDEDAALPAAEQTALVAALRKRGADWVATLADFVCLETTDRFVDKNGDGDFAPAGSLREMITYSGGRESYERLTDPGAKFKDDDTPKGVRSFGEFGGLMRAVLSEQAAADIRWKGFADLEGRKVHVFEFKVAQEKSMYRLTQETPFRVYKPAYSGRVLAETETMHVRRITIQTSEIPAKFPFQEASHEIDYEFQRLGGVTFLLPSKSVMQTRVGKRKIVRSEMLFSNYKKWQSESKIRFDVEEPKP